MLREGSGPPRIAFVTYYKGDYGLHVLERKEPLNKAASADFGAPGPVSDFQAPMTHTLIAANKKKKGKSAAAMKDAWDFYDIVQAVGGDMVAETCEGEGFDPKKPLSAQI